MANRRTSLDSKGSESSSLQSGSDEAVLKEINQQQNQLFQQSQSTIRQQFDLQKQQEEQQKQIQQRQQQQPMSAEQQAQLAQYQQQLQFQQAQQQQQPSALQWQQQQQQQQALWYQQQHLQQPIHATPSPSVVMTPQGPVVVANTPGGVPVHTPGYAASAMYSAPTVHPMGSVVGGVYQAPPTMPPGEPGEEEEMDEEKLEIERLLAQAKYYHNPLHAMEARKLMKKREARLAREREKRMEKIKKEAELAALQGQSAHDAAIAAEIDRLGSGDFADLKSSSSSSSAASSSSRSSRTSTSSGYDSQDSSSYDSYDGSSYSSGSRRSGSTSESSDSRRRRRVRRKNKKGKEAAKEHHKSSRKSRREKRTSRSKTRSRRNSPVHSSKRDSSRAKARRSSSRSPHLLQPGDPEALPLQTKPHLYPPHPSAMPGYPPVSGASTPLASSMPAAYPPQMAGNPSQQGLHAFYPPQTATPYPTTPYQASYPPHGSTSVPLQMPDPDSFRAQAALEAAEPSFLRPPKEPSQHQPSSSSAEHDSFHRRLQSSPNLDAACADHTPRWPAFNKPSSSKKQSRSNPATPSQSRRGSEAEPRPPTFRHQQQLKVEHRESPSSRPTSPQGVLSPNTSVKIKFDDASFVLTEIEIYSDAPNVFTEALAVAEAKVKAGRKLKVPIPGRPSTFFPVIAQYLRGLSLHTAISSYLTERPGISKEAVIAGLWDEAAFYQLSRFSNDLQRLASPVVASHQEPADAPYDATTEDRFVTVFNCNTYSKMEVHDLRRLIRYAEQKPATSDWSFPTLRLFITGAAIKWVVSAVRDHGAHLIQVDRETWLSSLSLALSSFQLCYRCPVAREHRRDRRTGERFLRPLSAVQDCSTPDGRL